MTDVEVSEHYWKRLAGVAALPKPAESHDEVDPFRCFQPVQSLSLGRRVCNASLFTLAYWITFVR